jgi:dienelactone hydrolase
MKKNLLITSLLISALISAASQAKIHTETVEYKEGKHVLEGYLAYDDANPKPKPGIVVVHDWMGLSDNTKMRAQLLAELGYVALAADIYGKGIRPKSNEEAGQLASNYKDHRNVLRARVRAAYDVLAKDPHVNNKKMAAIGYCFGGTTALELARSGAPLEGTISFHGGLSTPNPKDAKNIKGRVLVLHGGSDPFVGPAEVNSFVEEMNAANINWTMVSYGPAVHAFTIKEAGNDKKKGAAYDAEADRASWEEMKRFFNEIFGESKRNI